MLNQSYNQINIVGRLNEIDLKEKDSQKDNRHFISGKVDFLVEQNVGGQMEQSIIPVSIFAFEKTNAGKPNPAYQNAHDLMTKGTSVAATGDVEKADTYELTQGRVAESNFLGRDGTVASYTTINGSFFTKRKPGEVEECATFEQEIVIAQMFYEEKNETPTGRLIIDGLVIQYNGLPDKVRYYVENQEAISYISQNWEPEDTVKVIGKIRYCAEIQEIQSQEDIGFGEAPTKTRTRTVKEFVITSGTPAYDEDKRYDCEEVAKALSERKHVTETRLKQQQSASASANTGSSNRLSRGF